MIRLLMRADDLGYSEAVNYGIAKTVKEGIIRSVGVMPNMPATAHGLKLLTGEKVCLGQHTNICVGKPLTNPQLIPSITQSDGTFRPSREYRTAKQDFVVLDEVILEIEAQYERFLALTGEQPHYFEGHAVVSDNFFKGLAIVARRHGLKYLEMTVTEKPVLFSNTLVYGHMEAMKPDYDPVLAVKTAVEHAHEEGCDMFVCHPGYLDAYLLRTSSLTLPRTLEVEMACSDEMRRWLEDHKVKLVTFDDL